MFALLCVRVRRLTPLRSSIEEHATEVDPGRKGDISGRTNERGEEGGQDADTGAAWMGVNEVRVDDVREWAEEKTGGGWDREDGRLWMEGRSV